MLPNGPWPPSTDQAVMGVVVRLPNLAEYGVAQRENQNLRRCQDSRAGGWEDVYRAAQARLAGEMGDVAGREAVRNEDAEEALNV